jgi:hypothetical protein
LFSSHFLLEKLPFLLLFFFRFISHGRFLAPAFSRSVPGCFAFIVSFFVFDLQLVSFAGLGFLRDVFFCVCSLQNFTKRLHVVAIDFSSSRSEEELLHSLDRAPADGANSFPPLATRMTNHKVKAIEEDGITRTVHADHASPIRA